MHLPQWPLQRLLRAEPRLRAEPAALSAVCGKVKRIMLVSPRARTLGIKPGMLLAEAQAIEPRLAIRDEVPSNDRKALTALALWSERFSPLVAIEEGERPSTLLLDVTGCSACFGGEERLIAAAAKGIADLGWQARIALADTVGAGWALTHAGDDSTEPLHAPPGRSWPRLAELPVASLRLTPDHVHALKSLGIERIVQLAELQREELPSRFGPDVLRRLDQASGRLPEPVVPHRPLPRIEVGCTFEHPIGSRVLLQHVFASLLRQAEKELQRRCRGARRIECALGTDQGPTSLELELLRPCSDAGRLEAMLRVKLDQLRLSSPALSVSLRIVVEETLAEEQGALFDGNAAVRARGLSELSEALSTRFGRTAVTVVRFVLDPQPECAYALQPALTAKRDHTVRFAEKLLRHRPLRLWEQPKPVEVLALTPPGAPRALRAGPFEQQVAASWGPERIETGWWRGRDVRRDYYIVETMTGARLWIYRRLDDGHWFWHGCFD